MSGLGNKEIFSKNLRALMERFGKDRNQMCADLNFKYTTFADWYNGNKYPRIDKIEQIANYFGVLKSDLIEDKGEFFSIDEPEQQTTSKLPDGAVPLDFSNLHRIPILGQIAAGLPIYAEENIEGYTYTEMNGGAEYFALRVKGDSMTGLRILDGDIVIVRRQPSVEDGEIAVVIVDDENATMKRFYRTGSTVTLMPQSTNPAHTPQVYDLSKTKIEIIGKVVKLEVVF